jgi:hypothetical protein
MISNRGFTSRASFLLRFPTPTRSDARGQKACTRLPGATNSEDLFFNQFVSSTRSSAQQVNDQDHQAHNQEQVDQSSADMQAEPQKPQNQKNHNHRPKHIDLRFAHANPISSSRPPASLSRAETEPGISCWMALQIGPAGGMTSRGRSSPEPQSTWQYTKSRFRLASQNSSGLSNSAHNWPLARALCAARAERIRGGVTIVRGGLGPIWLDEFGGTRFGLFRSGYHENVLSGYCLRLP